MTKTRKFIKTVICGLLAVCCLSATLGIVACTDGKDDGKPKKYDINIRLINNFGQTWTYPLDVSEQTYEFEYTGKDMWFNTVQYEVPDDPHLSGDWYTPADSGANVFYITKTYCEVGGKNHSYRGPVKERGTYCVCVEADSSSTIWNYRVVYLNIVVK